MKISAKVSIEGIKPMLFNTFVTEILLDPKKSRSGTCANDPSEWKLTVLMDEKRRLYILDTYIIRSVTEGGKEIKSGRGNISKKVASYLEAAGCEENPIPGKIFLDGLVVPSDENLTTTVTEPVYLDVRSVVNPATKGRNVRYRIAAKAGWKISFILTWNDSLVSVANMKLCVESAGLFQGLGDGRKIGYGRFNMTSFDVIK